MFHLFDTSTLDENSVNFQSVNKLYNAVYRNLDTVKNAYRVFERRIIGKHNFIYRYLTAIPLLENNTKLEYVLMMRQLQDQYAKRYRLTYSKSYGEPSGQSAVFFLHVNEYVIMQDDPYVDITKRWYSRRPVKVLYHNSTSTDLPDLYNLLDPEDTLIYSISFPELALMYSEWRMEQTLLNSDNTVETFYSKALYPSILNSYMNVYLFNMLDWFYRYGELPEPYHVFPFQLKDYKNYLENYINEYVKIFIGTKYNYARYLKSYIAIGDNGISDQLDELRLSGFDVTPFNAWLLMAARIRYIQLLRLLFPRAKKASTTIETKYELEMRRFRKSQAYNHLKRKLVSDHLRELLDL